jgi:hypothetical protein
MINNVANLGKNDELNGVYDVYYSPLSISNLKMMVGNVFKCLNFWFFSFTKYVSNSKLGLLLKLGLVPTLHTYD